VKIIDLGQSCPLGTIKQRIQGTPDYIAPEQVHRRPINQRTDVFNIGATLYWVLTGRHVLTVLPRMQPGREIALVTPAAAPTPSELNPRVPPALSRLAMDCTNIDPGERPADMRAVATRLEMIEVILNREAGQIPPANPARSDWQDETHSSSDDTTVDMIDIGVD